MKYARSRIASSDGSAIFPAAAGIETFSVPATGLFLAAGPEVFRVVDVRRAAGVFLIFISAGGPPASAGAWFLLWTIFVFFGTD